MLIASILVGITVIYSVVSYFYPKIGKLLIYSAFIFILGCFTAYFIANSTLQGWIVPIVYTGRTITTDDMLFEYRIDIINSNQRTARVRMYVRNLLTQEEIVIRVNNGQFTRRTYSPEIWGSVFEIPRVRETDSPGIYRVSLWVFYHPQAHPFSELTLVARSGIYLHKLWLWVFEADFTNGDIFNLRVIHNGNPDYEKALYRQVPSRN